ncbi:MAG: peptidoglycan editing factor PgeF [Pseudomonadota bacterium]
MEPFSSDTVGVDAITAPALAAGGIGHAFFTRRGGMSSGIYASLNVGRGSNDAPRAVAENRRRVEAHLKVPAGALVTMNQIHSPEVLTLTAPRDDRPRADALVTQVPNIALGVLHADCAPVLFCDGAAQVVGAAHAGWRGASGGVLEATVAAMEALGARRERTVAVIGPTIGPKSYEVGPEFPAPILARHPNARVCFAEGRNGHFLFDLPGYILLRLAEAGLGDCQNLALDTYTDEARFFSYRRATHRAEPDYGRLVSAIFLKG